MFPAIIGLREREGAHKPMVRSEHVGEAAHARRMSVIYLRKAAVVGRMVGTWHAKCTAFDFQHLPLKSLRWKAM